MILEPACWLYLFVLGPSLSLPVCFCPQQRRARLSVSLTLLLLLLLLLLWTLLVGGGLCVLRMWMMVGMEGLR